MNLEKLSVVDPELKGYIDAELNRQRDKIELIASENIVTPAVMEAMGSVLTNKYAEGYCTGSLRCKHQYGCVFCFPETWRYHHGHGPVSRRSSEPWIPG